MTTLLTGLWLVSLVYSIAQWRRRRALGPVIVVPVLLVPIAPSADTPGDDEAWLRKQLDTLEPR
jgi:hypothetical protein